MGDLDRIRAIEEQLVEKERLELAVEVAKEKNLPAGQAKRLRGSTRAELAADADELLGLLAPGEHRSRKPRERTSAVDSPSGGSRPTDTLPVETNPAKLATNVPRGW